MICVSVAHSSKMHGAENSSFHINEYEVSKIASYSCFDLIRNHGHPCTLIDCGDMVNYDYAEYKTKLINSLYPRPELSIEIHLNSSVDKNAHYGEVLYQGGTKSYVAKMAAEAIAQSLNDGFTSSMHPLRYANKGAQTSDRNLFFLEKVTSPSIIVEGLFVSNDEHAKWLQDGGAQAYGVLVGNGILDWLRKAE